MENRELIKQELWALQAFTFQADIHALKITGKISKIVISEDDKTSEKQRVVEDLELGWNFLKTLYADLLPIIDELGYKEMPIEVPDLKFSISLWKTTKRGDSQALWDIQETISDFRQKISDIIFAITDKLDEDE